MITTTIDAIRVSGQEGVSGQSQIYGGWVSTEGFVDSATSISGLSLNQVPTAANPVVNPATTVSFATIQQGANIVYGTAAPLFGQPGGGIQIKTAPACILFSPFCQ
jgi:hypothetical protein